MFDQLHFGAWFGRDDFLGLFSPEAEIEAMLRFEVALAGVEAEVGVIPEAAAVAIAEGVAGFCPDIEALQAGVVRDGVVVPVLIAELRASLDEAHHQHLHFGATSQDVVDTGLMLRLKPALSLFASDIEGVVSQLDELAAASGGRPLMGRTRMQRALPIRLGDRIGSWRRPLVRHLEALDRLERDVLAVQFGGPVGTLEALGKAGPRVRALLAKKLDLVDPGACWHTERDRIADLAGWLSKVSGALGKIGQDVALMAQNEIGEVTIAGGGRSSAMAHKNNPVQAELLVALARANAGRLGTLHQALVHEGERSGSAWTLEWLIIPEMVAATGAALAVAGRMLDALEFQAS